MPHVAHSEAAPKINLQAKEEREYDDEYPWIVFRFQHDWEAAQSTDRL